LLIYWTFPTMKILAKVKVDYVIKSTPIEMWKETKSFSGISEEKFFKYFKNKKNAYAFKLGKIIKFKKPKKLSDFKISFAPQSFVYINN
jgi:predicted transcriptional regulator